MRKDANYCPQNLPVEFAVESRTALVPLDFRLLGSPISTEHEIGIGDVLGIYIADVVGDRDELPSVAFPSFRLRNAPVEPFVGQPIKVESDGTLKLPYVEPVAVAGLTLPQARDAISRVYVNQGQLVQAGRENIQVTLITPRFFQVNVFRQDTRYNVPGLQQASQFEISRRWSGTTLFLDPKESNVLNALNRTGGLPGIDAKNEIWIMKQVPDSELSQSVDPLTETLLGELPMMLPKENTKLIRIPLRHDLSKPLPFTKEDIRLGDGDVVFLPRRDGDTFMTGGVLPGGRFPLPRDRDVDIFEAIAISTGNNLGPVAAGRSPQFPGFIGGIVPPTDVTVVRRVRDDQQIKIKVDLKHAMDDPSERLKIMRGDLILLDYKPGELAANIALNVFDVNIGYNPD